ncbi:hypothetical protein PALI_a2583 [Pseudoalteromonas aliena SW19]|jgi:hypothetical protein|uniref:Uncharacterized protein n=1 Tax=Pseudoalteromonas aliena SW19 TaxID=1314866 RepID=A0ABR9E1V0_9GAMM|nr:hypothetical protein [Pseudoalteromonas aliena SW19]
MPQTVANMVNTGLFCDNNLMCLQIVFGEQIVYVKSKGF